MPLPEPSEGQTEDEFIESCMKADVTNKDFPDEKQRLAVCFSQYRKARGLDVNEPIPIMRAFESDGKMYVYGYSAIFNSPDSFGTVMTREVVDYSINTQLGKFPAVRFMHEEPFGQIVFDRVVNGIKTTVDDVGFLTLIEVYDTAKPKWEMVKAGHWGLSWSMNPKDAKIEYRKLADGKSYPTFVKGLIFEVSIVDSPSHADAVAYVMQRVFHSDYSDIGGVTRELTSEERDKLSDSDFAVVYEENGQKVRKLPIHDKAHAVAAWQALHGARGGVDLPASVRESATRKVKATLAKFGVETNKEERKMEEKDIQKMLDDRDTKLLESIKRMFDEKKGNVDFEKLLEDHDAKLMREFEQKLNAPATPNAFETAVESQKAEILRMNEKISAVRQAMTELKSKGEDTDALAKRVQQLETQRDAVISKSAEAVSKAVKGFEKRVAALEDAPEQKSPLTESGVV